MKIKNTQWYEVILVATAFVVYVVQRLFNEQAHVNEMSGLLNKKGIFSNMLLAGFGYNYNVNVILPVVGGAVLLLWGWLIFHLVVWPKLQQPGDWRNKVLSIALVLFFVFAAVFVFHWYMTYLRYTKDTWGNITGLKTYSLYRKKTVLSDAVGIAFLFVFYELVICTFQCLQKVFSGEKDSLSSVLYNIVPFIPAAILFYLTLNTQLPTPLWSSNIRVELWWISSIVFVWAMQEYVMRFLVPGYKAPVKLVLPFLFVFIVLFLMGNMLIWAADSNFYYYNYRSPFAARSFQKQLIKTLVPVLIIAVFRKIIFKEKTVLQQQVAGTSAELAQLRSQINPHFLFNALNSLYAAAMKEGAEKAADGIQRLGDMMRFMIQENNLERISVEKEIEYLHNYIHLQRIRIDETQGIDIKVVLNQPENDVFIAPMMLIPFVENAFKHGISHRSPSFIFITLSFDATHLYFRVQNSRHIRHEMDPEEYQSGIGLQNVQKRLQLLYPARHTLQLQETDHDYAIFLTISL